MKTGIGVALACVAATVSIASRAGAVETSADVETDHIDAADDGGPRTAGVLLHPFSMAFGAFGAFGAFAEVGVELDVALGENAALSVEGDWVLLPGASSYEASVGLPVFPQRFVFHGIYVHPRVEWASETSGGESDRVVGAVVTVGYTWTWPVGATLRLGGGPAYARALASDGAAPHALEGLHPRADGSVGWVF
jgi:hypothetical protein